MPLVTPKDQHISLLEEMVLAGGDQFDRTALTREVFARSRSVRNPDHGCACSLTEHVKGRVRGS